MLNTAWHINARQLQDIDPPYEVTFITDNANNGTISVSPNEFILDVSENKGYSFPYDCRAGSCGVCAMRLISGSVDQSDQSFLNEEQIDAGYFMSCVSYPQSDIIAVTNVEGELS